MSERDDLVEQAFYAPAVTAPLAPNSPEEVTLNRMAQHFYEASGLFLSGFDKPKVVKGLRAVLPIPVVTGDGTMLYVPDGYKLVKDDGVSDLSDTRDAPSEQVQELAFAAEQGLDFMLGLQRRVEGVWNRLVDPEDPAAVSAYIRDVVLCATDELHEVLAEVHWKPWKDKRGIKDVDKYREEMADVLHFVLDLYLAAGLSGRDIIVDYMSKHYENIDRATRSSYRES